MSLLRPDPQSVVIFGASGDLAARKVLPALWSLYRQDLLPEAFAIIGYARTHMTDAEFRSRTRSSIEQHSRIGFDESAWERFSKSLSYVSGEYTDEGGINELIPVLQAEEERFGGPSARLFYCATPPSAFEDIAIGLGGCGLSERGSIVVEKPFGTDLETARQLNDLLHRSFDESQILRIDHYLGKENVQNILVLRFSNGMFEPIWNRRYVAAVQIDVAESLGMEGRGRFYEEAGAIRDIVQNHLLQLLAILTMEPPASFDAESIRDEKVKLLRSVRPVSADEIVKGQYAAGLIDGSVAAAYRDEDGVAADSLTETYAAMRVRIENWRWAGVPILLRTGKRMPRRETTITVIFHDAPHLLFEQSGLARPDPNHLTIKVQPDEGIKITFDAKVPGPEMKVTPVDMTFDYSQTFGSDPPEAYERLLRDAMDNDPTLFTRADEIERAWEILEPILEKSPSKMYDAGTWGPAEADRLAEPYGWYVS